MSIEFTYPRLFVIALLSTLAVVQANQTHADEVTIGVAGPMTGDFAAIGQQLRNGAEMAVEDINATGGVNGRHVVLRIGDDQCDQKLGAVVAKQLANEGIAFVIGHACFSKPASVIYAQSGILQISPSAATVESETTFRLAIADYQLADVVASTIAPEHSGDPVVLISDDDYFITQVNTSLSQIGAFQVTRLRPSEVSEWTLNAAKGIYYGGELPLAPGILNSLPSNVPVVVTPWIDGDIGVLPSSVTSVSEPNPLLDDHSSALQDKLLARSVKPTPLTIRAYAAVEVWAKAAAAAGEFTPDRVARQLREQTFEGVSGFIRFDSDGTATMSPMVAAGNSGETCPRCPKSGNCPQSVVEAKKKCECPKSGNCTQ